MTIPVSFSANPSLVTGWLTLSIRREEILNASFRGKFSHWEFHSCPEDDKQTTRLKSIYSELFSEGSFRLP